MSLLAMAIEARGYQAMSFTGRQAALYRHHAHKAKIVSIDIKRILDALDAGYIPVVAGFQASTPTAISPRWAAVAPIRPPWRCLGINADVCEIYPMSTACIRPTPAFAPARAR
jgi:aspartate kinase